MRTKFLLNFLLLICSAAASAQNQVIRVTTRNEKKEIVQQATAALYQLPDSALVTKKITDGPVEFYLFPQVNYFLKLTAVGYQDIYRNISNTDTAIVVDMFSVVSNLGNVTVNAKRPLIKQEDDKTIVDAEVLASSSSNAYEILEKTPGAVIDQDGNVYLNSVIPATIYINGREMKLGSADLASLLKSLPAGSVSKIEILRTPSAKYDASSSGGIVNIVLKKGVKLGTSGSLNLGYFQGVYSTKTIGGTINKGTGKINSYLTYQYTDRNNFETLDSKRFIKLDSSLLSQQSYTTYPTKNNYLSAGIDYAFTNAFNLAYDLRISKSDGDSYAVNKIDINKGTAANLVGRNESDINNGNNTLFLGNNLNAKYKIDSLGSELTMQLEYDYYDYSNTQEYANIYQLPSATTISGNGDNNNRKNIWVAQSDLTYKFPKSFTLEAGIKVSFSRSDNNSQYFKDTGNHTAFMDVYQTNAFKYKENITAAYVQLSKTFAGFTFKPGLRFESTNINGRQVIPTDTTFSIKRNDVFPYVYLKHKLFKIFGFPLVGNAIYRRSIKRPYYEVLNPFPKYVDQYLFDVGNPSLKPQFTTNYELNATYSDIPVFAVGYNNTTDIFSNVTYQDNLTKIAYRTYDNLGRNKEFYARVVGGIPPGGKYFFYLGGIYNYNKYEGVYQGRPLNYSRGSFTFFAFQELKVTPTFTMNMQGFLRTKGLQNLYELSTFGGLYVSANKTILKKKVNIILSVNDLLKTNHVDFKLQQADLDASGSRVNDTRKINLVVRYNFGVGKKEQKKNIFAAPAEIGN